MVSSGITIIDELEKVLGPNPTSTLNSANYKNENLSIAVQNSSTRKSASCGR